MKNNILILADTNLKKDGRIRRHIFSLIEKYNITITGLSNPEIENVKFIDCSKQPITMIELEAKKSQLRERLNQKLFEEVYWSEQYILRMYEELKNKNYNLIIANDISMVPLGVELSKKMNIPIIADMHEYAPKEFEDDKNWRDMFQEYKYYLCRNYLHKCDCVFTVSKRIAKEYYDVFGIEVKVFTNAPIYSDININMKKTTNLIKLVYHGVCNKSRNLEELINLADLLDDRYSIDFYLIGNKNDEYYKNLINKIHNSKKCSLRKPVKPEEIITMLNNYDIGLCLIPPVNFNYENCLPNKFFEYIHGRLAIATGPSIEMKNYIQKFNCGVISDDFKAETLANKLNKLSTTEIDKYKINSEKFAKQENYQKNKQLLLKQIDKLLKI
ncbi:glycosyltransferase [Clostridium butyricum]|uniref:glycosyltransferase n=1 Tax=Clostridium butyricum TaxID=1492 RepID=UPI00374E661A